MALAVVQSKGIYGAAPPTLHLDNPPTAGNVLVLGCEAYKAGGSSVPVPAGWTALTAEYRNEEPGWIPVLAPWTSRLFYKVSDGTEQDIPSPAGAGSTQHVVIAAELPAHTLPIGAPMTGWTPHVADGMGPEVEGNRAAGGFAPLAVPAGRDALAVGFWSITGSEVLNHVIVVDQAGGLSLGAFGPNNTVFSALVWLPLTTTAAGVRLTGSIGGNDNFPFWGMAVLAAPPAGGFPPRFW